MWEVRGYAEDKAESPEDVPTRKDSIDAIGERYRAARQRFMQVARAALDEVVDVQ